MKIKIFAIIIFCLAGITATARTTQPNILWVLTDDHRYDSITAFNKMLFGQNESKLGYVESPQTDKLAKQGTTFINAYSQAQGCAPSRASMHYGRYPFHSGVYEFEYFNNTIKPATLTLPEQMAKLGYQTFHVGKLGVRIKTLNKNGKPAPFSMYQTDISFKKMFEEGYTGWDKGLLKQIDGKKLSDPVQCDWIYTPDGKKHYSGAGLEKQKGFENETANTDKQFDILRHTTPKYKRALQGSIIGGVSGMEAGKTRDGWYTHEMIKYLENPNADLNIGSQKYKGVDPQKPVFIHLGYDFPHTPVLPPQSFRERFKDKKYNVPNFSMDEYDNLPKQLQKLIDVSASYHFTDAQKQQMIQDYYAFCAYGDDLIGQAVKAFIKYSEKQKQPWAIVYVCGDHGWKLNEHGSVSKFSPWEKDMRNPIVIVTSDKKKFPADKVVQNFAEFMDIAPTILSLGGADLSKPEYAYLDGFDMAKIADDTIQRDYIIGVNTAVTRDRATIRTKDYMFSMRTRPNVKKEDNLEWVKTASYEDTEPVFYVLKDDFNEVNNLAYEKKYEGIINQLREKLLKVVFNNRLEVEWGRWGEGTTYYTTKEIPNADDKVLKLK